MGFDSSVLFAVLREVESSLVGEKVKDVKGWQGGFSIGFQRGSPLVVNLSPQYFSLFLSSFEFQEQEEKHSPFVLLLRKHLIGYKLVSVEQHEFDRIAIFTFEALYPGRFVERKSLVLELIPSRLNAVLIGEERRVITHWKGSPLESNFYLLPTLKCINPLLVGEFSQEMPLDLFQGVSKNVRSFLESFGDRLQGWNEWIYALREKRFSPTLFLTSEGCPIDYWVLDYDLEGAPIKKHFERPSQLIEAFLSERIRFEEAREKEKRRESELSDRRNYLLKKRDKLLSLIARKDEVRKLEIKGETIFANLSFLPSKSDVLYLPNPYTGEVEEIKLDPSLSLVLNAQRFLKEASKLRRGIKKAEEELKKVEEELSKIDSISSKEGKKEKEDLSKELPFREFRYGEWRILVGKGALSNEILTFKLASPMDVWLHVKGSPGSHVIIRNPSASEVPIEVIEFAASLAAYYSKAKMNTKVPVDYTLVRYVKRHPSGKKGAVLIRNEKTLWVRPRSGENP